MESIAAAMGEKQKEKEIMNEIILFYLEDCPYCHKARKALAELAAEDPVYADVKVNWIEERRQPDFAAQHGYDYWYVPTIFYQDRKLYEANPSQVYEDIKKSVKAALDVVCGESK